MSIEADLEALRESGLSEDRVNATVDQIVATGSRAIPAILRSIEQGGYDSERWNTLGLQFLLRGLNEEARQIFEKLLQRDPEETRGRNLNNLGIANLMLRNVDEAIKAFSRAFCYDLRFSPEAAHTLPAWKNLTTTIRATMPLVPKRLAIQRDQAVISGVAKEAFLKDFLLGGVVAGLVLFFVPELQYWTVDVWRIVERPLFDCLVFVAAIAGLVAVLYLLRRPRD